MACPVLGNPNHNPQRRQGLIRYQLLGNRGLEAVQNKRKTMFYEITLFDGDSYLDVHVIQSNENTFVTMADGGPLTRTARLWIKRRFWNCPDAPAWVNAKLESMTRTFQEKGTK